MTATLHLQAMGFCCFSECFQQDHQQHILNYYWLKNLQIFYVIWIVWFEVRSWDRVSSWIWFRHYIKNFITRSHLERGAVQ